MRYPAGVLEFTGLRDYSSTTVLALRALEADDVTQWQNPNQTATADGAFF